MAYEKQDQLLENARSKNFEAAESIISEIIALNDANLIIKTLTYVVSRLPGSQDQGSIDLKNHLLRVLKESYNKPETDLSEALAEAINSHELYLVDLIVKNPKIDIKNMVIKKAYTYHYDVNPITYWLFRNTFKGGRAICERLIKAGVDPREAEQVHISRNSLFTSHHPYENSRTLQDILVHLGLRTLNLSNKLKDELNTLLHTAILEDTIHIAEEYLKAGADPYFIDRKASSGSEEGQNYIRQTDLAGYTAMDKAIYDGKADFVALLLRYGVDPTSKLVPPDYHRDQSPLQTCIESYRMNTDNKLFPCLDVMLLAGAKISNEDLSHAAHNAYLFNVLKLAQAKETHPNDPTKQLIAVLQQNIHGRFLALTLRVAKFTLFSSSLIDEVIADFNAFALKQTGANNQESDKASILNELDRLLEKNKAVIPTIKFNFIKKYIMEPARDAIKTQETQLSSNLNT